MKIPDEEINLKYLEERNFDKYLSCLNKKLKRKKIVIYGAGAMLQAIFKHYELNLNILAISDLRYTENSTEYFSGYKTCAPDEIRKINPDYVLVATKKYLPVALKIKVNKQTKIKPLINKTIKEIWKEISEN